MHALLPTLLTLGLALSAHAAPLPPQEREADLLKLGNMMGVCLSWSYLQDQLSDPEHAEAARSILLVQGALARATGVSVIDFPAQCKKVGSVYDRRITESLASQPLPP